MAKTTSSRRIVKSFLSATIDDSQGYSDVARAYLTRGNALIAQLRLVLFIGV
jgi:hypothetical protein